MPAPSRPLLRPVFICSGNLCRSPMAEALFNSLARERKRGELAVSMGTLGIVGRSPPTEGVAAMKEVGIDIRFHGSQGISLGLLRAASHVFCMEQGHADLVLRADPSIAARVGLLGALDPDGGDPEIEDPVGQPIEAFRLCRDRLARCIRAFLAQHPAA